MIKLYQRDDSGQLSYHEAWLAEEGIIEHWGAVGTVGEHRVHPVAEGAEEGAAIEAILIGARARGFTEMVDAEHAVLEIVFGPDDSDPDDLIAWCEALDQELSDYFGWTGLGHSEGSSVDEDGIVFRCLVVDGAVAKEAIGKELEGTVFGEFREIRISG